MVASVPPSFCIANFPADLGDVSRTNAEFALDGLVCFALTKPPFNFAVGLLALFVVLVWLVKVFSLGAVAVDPEMQEVVVLDDWKRRA